METLLAKVKTIESEAAELVEKADNAGAASITQLRAREEDMVHDVRTKAQMRAQQIIQEHIHQAEGETNTIKQQGQNTAKTVHSAAAKNRADAVTLAHRLFKEEYLA